jgi:rhamnosyl/mannosyltransferase
METHLHALSTALRSATDVEVVVANTSRTTVREIVDGVPVTRLGTLVNLGAAPYTPGLRRLMRASRADVLHLHFPHPTAILAYLGSGFRGKLVVTYHSDIVRQRLLGAAFRPILDHALRRASAVICTSANYIASSPVLSRHRARCRVLPFGIPLERYADAAPDRVAEIRHRYGPRLVLAVGRLVGYKGFEHLIRAMRDVDGRLVLVGSGPLRSALHALAEHCGVAERTFFLDQVADTTPYFHAADVFVLPSIARSEAFGLVQVEAMAAGTPVVNTDIPSGVPFVSPDQITGITVPPANPHALARAIGALLDDPARARLLGAAGRDRARTHFSLEAMAKRTLELYDDVTRADDPAGLPRAAEPEPA